MGADTCASGMDEQRTRKDQKIFVRNKYLIGVTGAPRIVQLIKNNWDPPKKKEDIPNSIREIVSEYNCINSTEEEGELMQCCILFAYNGELFEILSDFQIAEYVDNNYSIGCGRPYALASLYETTNRNPLQRVRSALSCAEYLCVGVRGPFHIYSNNSKYSNEYNEIQGVDINE